MAITTTDVVTNVVAGNETAKNATTVVYCQRTGEFSKLNATYETSIGYSDLESKYTNRFDDTTYYFIGNETIVGG